MTLTFPSANQINFRISRLLQTALLQIALIMCVEFLFFPSIWKHATVLAKLVRSETVLFTIYIHRMVELFIEMLRSFVLGVRLATGKEC